jgi:hypothetical protein
METNIRPSAEHPPLTILDAWLDEKKTNNKTSPPYCHLLLKQKNKPTSTIVKELYAYIDHAHAGARQALRAPLGESLHPLHHNTSDDPAFGYPHKFNDTTLQGFFGEIIAGIIAEYYIKNDKSEWEVPVYLFRTHIVAFQQLEQMKQTGEWKRHIVGRTGDDGLAFKRDKKGNIIAWLACEAKCTRNHSSNLISDNHKKLSQPISRPIDLLRVIDALNDYCDDDYRQKWIAALTRYYWETSNISVRCDLSVYVCGHEPTRGKSWVPVNNHHKSYTGQRELTAAELHLPEIEKFIKSLYEMMDNPK